MRKRWDQRAAAGRRGTRGRGEGTRKKHIRFLILVLGPRTTDNGAFNFSEPSDIAAFDEIIASMPELDQKIAHYRMVGYTQVEIAQLLGITHGRVSQRISAMKKFFVDR